MLNQHTYISIEKKTVLVQLKLWDSKLCYSQDESFDRSCFFEPNYPFRSFRIAIVLCIIEALIHKLCYVQLFHILKQINHTLAIITYAKVTYPLFIKRASLNKKGIDYLSIAHWSRMKSFRSETILMHF